MSPRTARLLVLPGVTGIAALALGVPTAALAEAPHDPAGNNGTIKIQPYGGSGGAGNSPHPGCDFRLQLFGFDKDQTGTISFTGQAPTADAVTSQPLSGSQLLSDDRAGGGQDVDAHFDVRGADLGLTGTPAKQGFHVRVEVNADGAPGGAKTKVFWLSCPATAAPAAAPTGSSTGTTAAPATTSTTSTTSTTTTGSTSLTTQGVTSGAVTAPTQSTTTTRSSAQRTIRQQAVEQAGQETAAETLAGSTAPSSTGRTGAPSGLALPFTGLPAAALAGLGLAVLAAGGLAVAAGRRRRTSDVST